MRFHLYLSTHIDRIKKAVENTASKGNITNFARKQIQCLPELYYEQCSAVYFYES